MSGISASATAVHSRAIGSITAFDFVGSPEAPIIEQLFDGIAGLPSHDFLVDIRRLTTVGSEARGVCYRRAREITEHRIAVVGKSGFHRALVGFMVLAMRQRRTRFFTDEQEAMRWLQTGPGGPR